MPRTPRLFLKISARSMKRRNPNPVFFGAPSLRATVLPLSRLLRCYRGRVLTFILPSWLIDADGTVGGTGIPHLNQEGWRFERRGGYLLKLKLQAAISTTPSLGATPLLN